MFLISSDVTNPAAMLKIVDDNGQFLYSKAGLIFASIESNDDGTKRFVMPDGSSIEQWPLAYGSFSLRPAGSVGVYSRVRISGQLAAFWTREQDHPCVYTFAELP